MEVQEVLQGCVINENIIKLPEVTLDRKEYLAVKKALEGIGGKWKGGKIAGFVFKEDPTELLARVTGGEKVNLKKEFQFFATPDVLADRLVRYAGVEESDSILEPSAGQGAIVDAINRVVPNKKVDCYELMPTNQKILFTNSSVIFRGADFLESNTSERYDKIIANPPFTKNQDIKHIREMYKRLSVGGKLVSIASEHYLHSSNSLETKFQEWLDAVEAIVSEVKRGEFKESGTMVGGVIICITKT